MNKFDKVTNKPIPEKILNEYWIYEGKDESKWTDFTGVNLNRAPKAIALNILFLEKIIQINKSINGIFMGNFEDYNPQKYYYFGDVVLYNDVFYISLIDENSKDLNDENYWYKFYFDKKFLNFLKKMINE